MKLYKSAFTFVELTVAILIGAMVIGMGFKIFSSIVPSSEKIGEESHYYNVMGRFYAQLKIDLKAACKVEKSADVLRIEISTENFSKNDVVTYQLFEKGNQIVRKADGKSTTYDFGSPPEGSGKFTFEIE